MPYLYLDPIIYVPYAVSLRKKGAITLKEFYIENGEKLPIIGFKLKRMPNKDFIYLEFLQPLFLDVTTLVDQDAALTFLIHYEITHDDRTISVKHRQHIGMVKHTNSCKHLKHYNLKHACPAMYGLEAKRVLDDGGLPSGYSMHREILTFGLDGEDHNYINWVFETVDVLYPFEVLRHGTLH